MHGRPSRTTWRPFLLWKRSWCCSSFHNQYTNPNISAITDLEYPLTCQNNSTKFGHARTSQLRQTNVNMSKRTSSRIRKLNAPKMSTSNQKEASTSPPADILERRRMQNRLAQRNHRQYCHSSYWTCSWPFSLGKKVRDHINALETRVINSMLQRPPAYVALLPHSTSPSGTSTPLCPPTQTLDQDLRAIFDTNDATCLMSPSYHGSPTGYITPTNETESYFSSTSNCLPLASPVPPSVDSRVPGVTFEILQQYQSPYTVSEIQPCEDALFRQDTLPFGLYSHPASPLLLPSYEVVEDTTNATSDLTHVVTYDHANDLSSHQIGQHNQSDVSRGPNGEDWLDHQLGVTNEYVLQQERQGVPDYSLSLFLYIGTNKMLTALNRRPPFSETASYQRYDSEYCHTSNIVFDSAHANQSDTSAQPRLHEHQYQDTMSIYRSPRQI